MKSSKPRGADLIDPGQVTSIEHLKHVTLWWLDNAQIVVVRMENPAQATVDTWAARNLAIRQNWPAGKPLLMLIDVSNDMTMTPYMRAKTEEVSRVHRELIVYTALLITPNLTGQILRLFTRAMQVRQTELQQRVQFFFEFEEGLKWLRLQIPAAKSMEVNS